MTGPVPETLGHRIELIDEDYISAIWMVTRHSWSWQRIGVAFALLWLAFSLYIVILNALSCGWISYCALRSVAEGAAYATGIILVHGALTAALLPRRARRQLADTRRLSSGYDVTIDAEAIRFETTTGHSKLGWGQFKRWHENAKLIVLVIIEEEILILPKSQLDPGVVSEVRKYLVAAQVERGVT